jgi:hypothetical protein
VETGHRQRRDDIQALLVFPAVHQRCHWRSTV